MNVIQVDAERWIKTTCAYCGVGCGIEARAAKSLNGEDYSVVVRGDDSHPANFGRLCSKGLALGETVGQQGRQGHPQIYGEVSRWDAALNLVAQRFEQTIAEHGPDSVAFYVSGQLLTEDYYVANKLMKGFIGSGNIDTNSRLCMSSSVAGHKRAFGTDTVPNAYVDLELADLVVLVGSNLAWCHPVLFQRLKAAKAARPEMRVVVIDPRQTETCAIVDLYLPINPGTDVLLFNGLLLHLAQHNKLDPEYIANHTEGFSAALSQAESDCGDIHQLCRQLGLPLSLLATFYQWVGETDKTLTVYSQGVNQSSAGADKVNAIINTHLATGRIGKEGCGPLSATGQPNAMGGREVGGLANTLAAHMEFNNPEAHQLISNFWQTDRLASTPGYKAVDLFDAVAEGKIKAIWIMATNPAASLPNSDRVRQALANCDFVVVSDCIANTDTTAFAHVMLPAQGWGEKSGTVTNSERRISRQRQILPSFEEAKPDWWIVAEVAKRMGFAEQFSYGSEADVFREYTLMTALGQNLPSCRRDLDLTGLSYLDDSQYDTLAPVQWPCPTEHLDDSAKRFFANGGFFTASAKGQFVATAYKPPQTQVSVEYPMILNSGRIRDQWHTMTRTGLVARLSAHRPEPFVSINALDAKAYGIKEGSIAQVSSYQGSTLGRAKISDDVRPGQIFMPIHWTNTNSSHGRISAAITPETDPVSGQPEAKFTPVALQPWPAASEAIVVCCDPLRLANNHYWVRQRIAHGFMYYIASQLSAGELAELLKQTLPEEFDVNSLGFSDSASGACRQARIRIGRLVDCLIVSPNLSQVDYSWLAELLTNKVDIGIERSLLRGKPDPALAQGKQICACKKVGLKTIERAIINQQLGSVEAVSAATQAGTGCGSCLPEVAEILAQCHSEA